MLRRSACFVLVGGGKRGKRRMGRRGFELGLLLLLFLNMGVAGNMLVGTGRQVHTPTQTDRGGPQDLVAGGHVAEVDQHGDGPDEIVDRQHIKVLVGEGLFHLFCRLPSDHTRGDKEARQGQGSKNALVDDYLEHGAARSREGNARVEKPIPKMHEPS